MSQKSELTVPEPDENLLLKKQLEEKLQKQKERGKNLLQTQCFQLERQYKIP